MCCFEIKIKNIKAWAGDLQGQTVLCLQLSFCLETYFTYTYAGDNDCEKQMRIE